MEDDKRTVTVTQNEGEHFAIEQGGGVALYGDKKQPALQHQILGQVIHATNAQQPLVHMVCWDEDDPCKVDVAARVVMVGDETAPVEVKMTHHFTNDHHQTHHIEPVDHTLKVDTKLAEPIHHALQLRTPLQLRFCNPWHIASDYQISLTLGNNRLISIRLTGATVATPQPCDDENC